MHAGCRGERSSLNCCKGCMAQLKKVWFNISVTSIAIGTPKLQIFRVHHFMQMSFISRNYTMYLLRTATLRIVFKIIINHQSQKGKKYTFHIKDCHLFKLQVMCFFIPKIANFCQLTREQPTQTCQSKGKSFSNKWKRS